MDTDQSQDTKSKDKKLKELEEKWKDSRKKSTFKTKETSAPVAVVAQQKEPVPEIDPTFRRGIKAEHQISPTIAKGEPGVPTLMQFKQTDKNSKQNHLVNTNQNTLINNTIN